jgi:chromosome segregation ATPase
MCKKIGIAAIVVVAGLLVLNKTKLGDWARYGWHRAKEAMNHSLPPEEEVKRLRYELSQLEPEMNKNMDALASERFAAKELRKEVEDGRIALDKRFNEFKHAKNDLKDTNLTRVSFDGRQMKKSDAEAAIASQWETYKTAEKTLKAKEKLLDAKEAQVGKMEEQVLQWKNIRDQMKAEIDAIEAEIKNLRLAEAANRITEFDNSRLSRFQESLTDLKRTVGERQERVKVHAEFNGTGQSTGGDKPVSADRAMSEIEDREKAVANK